MARLNKTRRILLIVAVLLLALVLFLPLAWIGAPYFLIIDGRVPQKTGALVVLGGESGTRGPRAAEVYAQCHATLVIASGEGDCNDLRRVMEVRGVPAKDIEMEPDSRTTRENALNTAKLLRSRGVTNAVLVTSWFHSRRALACFQEAAPEIRFTSCPTKRTKTSSWWPDKYERARIVQEYTKMVYYWVAYGVSPWG